MLPEYRGIKFITHGGSLDGFLSYLLRQPDEAITVVILMNSTPPFDNFDPGNGSFGLAEYLLWQEMAPQVTYTADTSLSVNQLGIFTGSYDYGRGMILNITLVGEHLMAQMTGQSAFEIFSMGNNEFYWKVVEAHIKFITDEKGMVTGAIHYQGGQELGVPKIIPD
jgi:hypothetical protein